MELKPVQTDVELHKIAIIDVGPASWGLKQFMAHGMVNSEKNRRGVKFLPLQVVKKIHAKAETAKKTYFDSHTLTKPFKSIL